MFGAIMLRDVITATSGRTVLEILGFIWLAWLPMKMRFPVFPGPRFGDGEGS
jgi:hypothetical protein